MRMRSILQIGVWTAATIASGCAGGDEASVAAKHVRVSGTGPAILTVVLPKGHAQPRLVLTVHAYQPVGAGGPLRVALIRPNGSRLRLAQIGLYPNNAFGTGDAARHHAIMLPADLLAPDQPLSVEVTLLAAVPDRDSYAQVTIRHSLP